MTPSFVRGRARRASRAHVGVRVGHAVLGGTAGIVWLVLPMATGGPAAGGTVPAAAGTAAPTVTAQDDESSPVDLILPVAVVGTAAVLAGYAYIRRTRRPRGTAAGATPGGATVAPPSALVNSAELAYRARALLVAADNWVRSSREELGFAEAVSGTAAVEPFARAVREAETELTAAFLMRQRYEEGVPADATGRRQALVGIVGRCEEAGRLLDAEAADFHRLRGLDTDPGAALGVTETRFRELTARTATADAVLSDLVKRYGPAAVDPVAGYVELAKDRMVLATTRLNAARQAADQGELALCEGQLGAAESAVAQSGVFVSGVERLAADLSTARALLPTALTGAEAELASARRLDPGLADIPAGDLTARLRHADIVLAAIREELTTGTGDPLDALRRVVRACAPVGGARAGVLATAALLTARGAVADADGFVTTHRGAVNWAARTRLAEARRLLNSAAPDELVAADDLAHEARDLAERDVRTHGTPYAGAEEHAAFGGPRTRGRREPPPL